MKYYVRRQRSRFVKDADDILEKAAYYLNQPRHQDLFPEKYTLPGEDALTMAGRPVEEVVDDIDEHDRYFSQLEEKRFMTGGEILAMSDDDGWQ